jgi:hypothetical protein
MKEASRALPPEAMENEANEDSTRQAASPDNYCRITIHCGNEFLIRALYGRNT